MSERPVTSCAEVRLQATLEFLRRLRQSEASGVVSQHRITGLSLHFQLRGWENLGQLFVVWRVLRGCVKERTSRDSRKPVSFALLRSLLTVLQSYVPLLTRYICFPHHLA